jgi:outer membrane lipoprotein LolB
MSFHFRAALLALPILVAGCAGVPTAPAGPGAPQAYQQPSYHRSIDIGGRLSVRYRQNGRDEALHGSFTWSQRPDGTEIALLSPLGQTLAQIRVTPAMSTLTQSGQGTRIAADADALAAETLGWPLPVSGLRDWLQGFNAGGKRIAAGADAEQTINDAGWRIRYAAWDTDADGSAHPKRIDLTRDTEQAGEVSLRIVLDSWQPH